MFSYFVSAIADVRTVLEVTVFVDFDRLHLFHECVNDGLCVERFQIGVSLSSADEYNRLTRYVGHGNGGSNLEWN